MHKILDALLSNSVTFNTINNQVSPSSITAFGIQLDSRYGKAYELIQMLQFAQDAAVCAVAHYVHQIYFDSKIEACRFAFHPELIRHSEIDKQLYHIASANFSQFFWYNELISVSELP